MKPVNLRIHSRYWESSGYEYTESHQYNNYYTVTKVVPIIRATLHFVINVLYAYLDDVIGRSFTEHLVNLQLRKILLDFIPMFCY